MEILCLIGTTLPHGPAMPPAPANERSTGVPPVPCAAMRRHEKEIAALDSRFGLPIPRKRKSQIANQKSKIRSLRPLRLCGELAFPFDHSQAIPLIPQAIALNPQAKGTDSQAKSTRSRRFCPIPKELQNRRAKLARWTTILPIPKGLAESLRKTWNCGIKGTHGH